MEIIICDNYRTNLVQTKSQISQVDTVSVEVFPIYEREDVEQLRQVSGGW